MDAKYYRNIARNEERIGLFPNVIVPEAYRDAPAPPKGFRKFSVYLAGSFQVNNPVESAAGWMIDAVLPLVWKELPELQFDLVGRGSYQMFGSLKDTRITVTGWLDSVLLYLCNIRITLVPLHFGSGTRFKILEAATCRIPIVSTTLGAEGIPVTNGKHLLLADDPPSFAGAILKLLSDLDWASDLATNCRDLVRSHSFHRWIR